MFINPQLGDSHLTTDEQSCTASHIMALKVDSQENFTDRPHYQRRCSI
jgi:hypothetical protein